MLTYFLVDLYLLDVVRFTVAEVRFLGLVVLNFSVYLISFMVSLFVVTPHTQRERGKVIGVGVHICVYGIIIYVCGIIFFLL